MQGLCGSVDISSDGPGASTLRLFTGREWRGGSFCFRRMPRSEKRRFLESGATLFRQIPFAGAPMSTKNLFSGIRIALGPWLCMLCMCWHVAAAQAPPTAAEMSRKETVASALVRDLQAQEYEVRSAAEAMPEERYSYRPAEGKFQREKPEFGPAEVRAF